MNTRVKSLFFWILQWHLLTSLAVADNGPPSGRDHQHPVDDRAASNNTIDTIILQDSSNSSNETVLLTDPSLDGIEVESFIVGGTLAQLNDFRKYVLDLVVSPVWD